MPDKEISVKKDILCNLSSDPQIRHVELYAVYFRELVISLPPPLSLSSKDKTFLV